MSNLDECKLKDVIDQIRLLADNLEELRAELATLRAHYCAYKDNDKTSTGPLNKLYRYKNKIKNFLLLRSSSFTSNTICVSRGNYFIRPGDPNDEKTLPYRPSTYKLPGVSNKIGHFKNLFTREKCEVQEQPCPECPEVLPNSGNTPELSNENASQFLLDVTCESETQFGAGSSSWAVQTEDYLNDYPNEDNIRSRSGSKKSVVTNCVSVQTEPFFVILKMGRTEGSVNCSDDSGAFNFSKMNDHRVDNDSKLRLNENKLTLLQTSNYTGNYAYWKNGSACVTRRRRKKERTNGGKTSQREFQPVCRRQKLSPDSSISVDLDVTVSKDHDVSNDDKGFARHDQGYNHNWFNRSKNDTVCIEQQISNCCLSFENFADNEKKFLSRKRNSIRNSNITVSTSTTESPKYNYWRRNGETLRPHKENVRTQTGDQECSYCLQTSHFLEKDLENILKNNCTEINSILYDHSHL